MLFNSFEFLVFLPVVFLLYWFFFHRNVLYQNMFVLIASYVFYGWWDYRFLGLIFVSSVIDYFVGLKLNRVSNLSHKKILLAISLTANIGLLGIFKYLNFFIESFIELTKLIEVDADFYSVSLILPVGISFYTFQTLGYSIDIYKNNIKPTKSFISFLAYVSFFPQLVAGPIERASKLLPQFSKERKFNYAFASDGLRQILWGLFKKIVVADNLAGHVNYIYTNFESLDSYTIVMGAIYFSIQIYCDFSGYSDIAIGTAKLFGFDLMRNFNYPYFSRNIAEFWRRWHISLSSWFRDYLYIPLGGSRVNKVRKIRNVFAIFIVSGIWHGANWTFMFWGFVNAILFIPFILNERNIKYKEIVAVKKRLPSLTELFQIIITFLLVTFIWIFFRSESIMNAFSFLSSIFYNLSIESSYELDSSINFYILILFFVEWLNRTKQHGLEIKSLGQITRWIIYFILIILIFHSFDIGKQTDFIYFQF